MKIVQVLSALDGGGVERTLIDVLPHLLEKCKVDFIVFSSNVGSLEPKIREYGCKIYHITPKRENYIKFIFQVRRLMQVGSYDIVHCHLAEKGFWFYYWGARFSKKTIMHSHGCWNKTTIIQDFKKNVLVKLCRRYVDRICSCSTKSAKYLLSNHYVDSTILLNSFDVSKYVFSIEDRNQIRYQNGIKDDTLVIGLVARLSPEKNHLFILELLKEIGKLNKIKLMIAGDGPYLSKINEFIHINNMSNSVILLGNVKKISSIYSAFDIFVMPSIHEGFGMALVEAQINGLDCIISQYITDEAIVLDNRVHRFDLEAKEIWKEFIEKHSIAYDRNVDLGAFMKFSSEIVANNFIRLYREVSEC